MRKSLKRSARFAQLYASNFYFADPEFLADQMIQWHAARDDVTPSAAEIEVNFELRAQSFDCFGLNQRQLPSRLGLGVIKIAVTLEAAAWNSADFVYRLHRPLDDGSDVN